MMFVSASVEATSKSLPVLNVESPVEGVSVT